MLTFSPHSFAGKHQKPVQKIGQFTQISTEFLCFFDRLDRSPNLPPIFSGSLCAKSRGRKGRLSAPARKIQTNYCLLYKFRAPSADFLPAPAFGGFRSIFSAVFLLGAKRLLTNIRNRTRLLQVRFRIFFFRRTCHGSSDLSAVYHRSKPHL